MRRLPVARLCPTGPFPTEPPDFLSAGQRLGKKRQALVHPVVDAGMVVEEFLVAMCNAELVQPPHESARTVKQIELVLFAAVDVESLEPAEIVCLGLTVPKVIVDYRSMQARICKSRLRLPNSNLHLHLPVRSRHTRFQGLRPFDVQFGKRKSCVRSGELCLCARLKKYRRSAVQSRSRPTSPPRGRTA